MKTKVLWRNVLVVLVTTALSAGPALSAPPEGRGNAHGEGHGKQRDTPYGGADVQVTVSAGITIGAARDLAVRHQLTGYQTLPPGIAKNLARGKPLPPGIAKKMVPGPMLAQLPVHPGYEWRVAGTDLILVAIGTAIVVDILADVFR